MKKKLYVLCVIFGLLWILVTAWVLSGASLPFDEFILDAVKNFRTPLFDIFFLFLHYLFSVRGMVIVCVILLIIPKTRIKIGIPITSSLLVSALFNTLIKNIISRPRPPQSYLVSEHGFSYPSGHVSASSALCATIILLVFLYVKNKRLRILFGCLCVLCVICVMLCRIYLGVHYPSDCIAGALSGSAIGLLVSRAAINLTLKKERP